MGAKYQLSIFPISILVILFASCENMKPRARNHQIKAFEFKQGDSVRNLSAGFMVYDATRRGSFYFVDYQTGKIKVVSEPPPDAVVTLSQQLDAGVKLKEDATSIEAKYKAVQGIAELGKRTAAVNILRDALYKLAEIKISNDSIDERTERLFLEALKVACQITVTEAEFAKAESEKAIKEQYKSLSNMTPEQINAIPNKPNTAMFEYNTIIKSILSMDFSEKNLQAKDTAILKKAINDLKSFDDKHPQYFSAWELYTEFKKLAPHWSAVLTDKIIQTLANNKYGMTEENKAIVNKLKK